MSKMVYEGNGERVRPNWRRSDSFNASEKFWLRKVSLWENRPMTDEETWWMRVLSEVAKVPMNDPDKFTAESLKKKYTQTPSTNAPAAKAKAAVGR